MGAHNLRTDDDGTYQEIPIARSVKHPRYEPNLYLNDVAILHLVRDVEFSGRFKENKLFEL